VSLQLAVGRRRGRRRSLYCCKSLRSKAELVVRSVIASDDRSRGTRKMRNLRRGECNEETVGEDTAH
jgi:hypothetical protein